MALSLVDSKIIFTWQPFGDSTHTGASGLAFSDAEPTG